MGEGKEGRVGEVGTREGGWGEVARYIGPETGRDREGGRDVWREVRKKDMSPSG